MKLRRVWIKNFRGIREAEWILPADRFVCLVGPGDSTKTTLLDAIALVLSPKWTATFTDADFYSCDVRDPITIRIAVSGLPSGLMSDTALGMHLSGIKPGAELTHDPGDDAEPCVMIQLRVGDSHEPHWTVVRLGEEEAGVPIAAALRERFGLFRVDDRVDTHMRWSRGSALSRLTSERIGTLEAVTNAQRNARETFFDAPPEALTAATKDVAAAAQVIGGKAFTNLRPGLEATSGSANSSLLLHDDKVPLTGHGLGTRRLTSLAIQEMALPKDTFILIDEVESGLEPHRLQHLLRHLKKRTDQGASQVLVTTHSPVAVQALSANDISVVRSTAGVTTVDQVPSSLEQAQGTLRMGPAAVLSRRVVVTEGKTENGLCRQLFRHWDEERARTGEPSHAALGVAHIDGQGSTSAPVRAIVYQRLGYPTLLIVDNDVAEATALIAAARAAGVEVVQWSSGNAIEDEIVVLDNEVLKEFVGLAVSIRGEQPIQDAVRAKLKGQPGLVGIDPTAWTDGQNDMAAVRSAIATAAKHKSNPWFKREDHGEELADLLIKLRPRVAGSPLAAGLSQLKKFVYSDTPTSSPLVGVEE